MMPKDNIPLRKIGEGRYSIDVRGYTCPYPEVFARRALATIASGEVLELLTDNAPSCETIPAAAEELKNKVVEVKKEDGQNWRIVIQKQ